MTCPECQHRDTITHDRHVRVAEPVIPPYWDRASAAALPRRTRVTNVFYCTACGWTIEATRAAIEQLGRTAA